MTIQRPDIAELMRLAEAYDWESFQQRLRGVSLESAADVVRALGILQEMEREGQGKAAAAHMVADDLVLRYIDNTEVTRAFYGVHR